MSQDAVTPPPAPSFRRQGNLLLLSGQVGVDESWRPVTETFHDEARDLGAFSAYNVVWAKEFPELRPARTTIGAQLVPPFRVELDIVAWFDDAP
jgi:2-iminobutanoate/2-iminopropanoate deaminase